MIERMNSRVTIASLHVYPVKSGRVIDCSEAQVGPRGLRHDRHWMLVDQNGRFLTQRSHPQLARLCAEIESEMLRLQHPDCGELRLPLPIDLPLADAPISAVSIWKREHPALDAGDEAANFCTQVIGKPARLVSAIDQNFPDGYPLLVCNEASLVDLNARMQTSLPMNRFRPNLVLRGLEPWDEDRIATLRIGTVRLKLVKPCTRCVITSLDQTTGASSTDPLPTLRAFRWNAELRGVTFGQNAEVQSGSGSTLRVGDAVEVNWR
jgi:uncharacterized protein YcbX